MSTFVAGYVAGFVAKEFPAVFALGDKTSYVYLCL